MAYKLYGDLEIVSGSTSYGLLKNVAAKANSISTAATKGVKTLSAIGDVGWSNQADGDANVISKAFMAYWNGRYNGSSSNLTYAHQGEIQCKPTVLYNNATGTVGTITLSQTAANFTFLKIYYRKNNQNKSYGSVTIYSPNGKTATITHTFYSGNTYGIYVQSRDVLINGTSITKVREGWEYIYNDRYNTTSDDIYIVRVEGWK